MKKIVKLIFSYLSALTLFGGAFSIVVSSFEKANASSFDFSKDSNSTIVNSSDVLKLLTNSEINSYEKQYVDTYDEYKVTYQNNEHQNDIEVVDYYSDLYVYAEKHNYVDTSERDLSWVPYIATYNGEEAFFSLENGKYKATLTNYDGESKNVEVKYKLDVQLNKNKSNALLNLAYNYAKTQADRVAVNDAKEDKYLADQQAYIDYLVACEQYEIDLVNYNAYLDKKNEYDVKKEKYDAYLKALEQYNKEYQAYIDSVNAANKWEEDIVKYQQYLLDKEYYDANHETNQAQYDAWVASRYKINYRMDAMKIPYTSMTSLKRDIYSAIMGGTVDSVLSRKEDLMTLGVPESAIDRSSDATVRLREALSKFNACSTDEQKYNYYKSNYSYIKNSAQELARCLTKFLDYNLVISSLETTEKLEKYYILVAQLIYFSDAISNGKVYNYEAWNNNTQTGDISKKNAAYLDDSFLIRIDDGNGKKTYKQILSGTSFMEIHHDYARPGSEAYNQDEVTLIPEPTYVANPGSKPTILKEPVKPASVENPGPAPTVVEKPVKPSTVLPAVAPTYDVLTETEQIYAALCGKEIPYREEFTSNPTISFYDTYSFNFESSLKHLVKFYNDKGVLLEEKVVTLGTSYDTSKLPTYDFEKTYVSYEILWVDNEGNVIFLDTLNYSTDLTAFYSHGDYINYTVTWVVDGSSTVETYHYGDMPIAPKNPSKPETEIVYYVFTGWDKAISSVKGNITYTAIFEEKDYLYIKTIVGSVITEVKYSEEDIIPELTTPTRPDEGDTYYDFLFWSKNVVDSHHITYEAVFTQNTYYYVTWVVNEVVVFTNWRYRQDQTARYPLGTPKKAGDAYYTSYSFVGWKGSNGQFVDLSLIKTNITLYAEFEGNDFTKYTITYLVDGEVYYEEECAYGVIPTGPDSVEKPDTDTSYFIFTGWEGGLSAVTGDATYTATFEEKPLVFVTVVVDGVEREVKVHAISDLNLDIPTKTNQDGYRYTFKEWSIQKEDDTHYVYTAVFNTYFTVTFIIEGEISSKSYLLGESVSHENPSKLGDHIYYYVFTGWTNESGQIVDLSSIQYSVTLNAHFEQRYVIYYITWVIGEENIIDEYIYNQTIEIPTNVSIPDSEDYYYIFASWDKTPAFKVTENATYVAQFNQKSLVKVYFYQDATLLSLFKYRQGETIQMIKGPSKEEDDRHKYTFDKWVLRNDSSAYIKNYVASYISTNIYYVTWMSEGEIIAKDKFYAGDKVTYDYELPTKEDIEKQYFEFDKWNIVLPNSISSDLTITAVFKVIDKFIVKFITKLGEDIRYYKPLEAVNYCPDSLMLDTYDNVLYYQFDTFDGVFESLATKNSTYNAKYKESYLVKEEGKETSAIAIQISESSIFIDASSIASEHLDISIFLDVYKTFDLGKPLSIKTKNATIDFSTAKVNYLISNKVKCLNINLTISKEVEYTLEVVFTDGIKSLDLSSLDLVISIRGIFYPNNENIVANGEKIPGSCSDNLCQIQTVIPGVKYEIYPLFNVSVETNLNYTFEFEKTFGRIGENINFIIKAKDGYRINKITAKFADGSTSEISDKITFTKSGDITLIIELEHVLYKVQFIVDGVVVYETFGYYGDLVIDPGIQNPEILDKPDDSKYRYSFIGWDKEVTTITGDTIYTAVYEQIELTFSDLITKSGIIKYGIAGGAILVVGVPVTIVLIIVLKRRKKAKISQ